jgi:hypothetical protein
MLIFPSKCTILSRKRFQHCLHRDSNLAVLGSCQLELAATKYINVSPLFACVSMTNALWRQAMSTTEKDKSVPLLSVGGHFDKGDIQVRISLNILILSLDIHMDDWPSELKFGEL